MLLTRASEYALLSLDKIRKSDKPMGAEKLAKELLNSKKFFSDPSPYTIWQKEIF